MFQTRGFIFRKM